MKNRIISFLQKLLGFDNYLFVFSIFTILKLRWDKNERDFLKIFDIIDDSGTVLDIGANIGIMTTHFARRLKNSMVFSFEPVPYNYIALKRIIKFFNLKNVKVFDYALGDGEGKLKMIMPVEGSAKKQGLSHVKNQDESTEEQGEEFEVLGKQLDKVEEIATLDKKITAIKIDVEGFELKVLEGAKDTVLKHKPIIYCELWAGEQRGKTFEFMHSLGYSAKVNVKGQLVDFTGQEKHNFYFIPK